MMTRKQRAASKMRTPNFVSIPYGFLPSGLAHPPQRHPEYDWRAFAGPHHSGLGSVYIVHSMALGRGGAAYVEAQTWQWGGWFDGETPDDVLDAFVRSEGPFPDEPEPEYDFENEES